MDVRLLFNDVVPYGKGNSSVGLAYFTIDAQNLHAMNATLNVYREPVPLRVVLVRSSRQPSKAAIDFEAELSSLLSLEGANVERMHLDQLRHDPPEFAVYVIESDYMPASVMGAEPGHDILSLASKGSVVIFAGIKPTTVTFGDGERTDDIDANAVLSRYGISFGDVQSRGFTGISARNPLYSVNGPEVRVSNGNVYSVGFTAKNSTGKLVIIPQTVDSGWAGDGARAAQDIYSLIRTAAWASSSASGSISLPANSSSTEFSVATVPSSSISANSYSQLVVYAMDAGNRTLVRPFSLQASTERTAGGDMYQQTSSLPSTLTGRPLLVIGENLSSGIVDMSLQAYRGASRVEDVPLGPQSSFLQYQYDMRLPPGDYVLKLVDSRGTLYARSYLHVPRLTVERSGYDWGAGRFQFRILADNSEQAGALNISNIMVSLDSSKPAAFSAANGILEYRSPSAPVPAGKHRFTFDFGNGQQHLDESYIPPTNWWDDTRYQLAIVAVGVVFLIGFVLRRPDVEMYGLDVPDFPPLSKIAIPIGRQTVMNIFESVNRDYKWRYMPLKIEEVKSGFRKIPYKGKGILIGDYNSERIMDALVQKGHLKRALGMYLPSAWEKESGRSARYLAMFRKMRDTFVNNAVMFSEINSSSDYDSLASIGRGAAFQLCEADSPAMLERILRGSQKYRQVLLFADEAERDDFERSLNSTSKSRVMAKMLFESDRLALVAIDQLQDYLKSHTYS
jgi:hypothetical protein